MLVVRGAAVIEPLSMWFAGMCKGEVGGRPFPFRALRSARFIPILRLTSVTLVFRSSYRERR